MARLLAFLTFALVCFAAHAAEAPQPGDVAVRDQGQSVRFTLITPQGYVGFTTGEDWSVLNLQSHAPIAAVVFQIPDPADSGTRDSTNLIVALYQSGDATAQARLSRIAKSHTGGTATTLDNWKIYTRQDHQGDTLYTIEDAQAPCGDMICNVRLAWPHLVLHAGSYDTQMDALFKSLLQSVQGAMGPYQVHAGEAVRRPEN